MEVFACKSVHALHATLNYFVLLSFSLKDVIFAVHVWFSGLSLTFGLTLTQPSSQNAVWSGPKAEPRGRPSHQGEATQRHFQGWRHRTRALKVFHKINKRPTSHPPHPTPSLSNPPFVGWRQWSRTEWVTGMRESPFVQKTIAPYQASN